MDPVLKFLIILSLKKHTLTVISIIHQLRKEKLQEHFSKVCTIYLQNASRKIMKRRTLLVKKSRCH